MALYSMKAVLHGKARDVFEMIAENFPKQSAVFRDQVNRKSALTRPDSDGVTRT